MQNALLTAIALFLGTAMHCYAQERGDAIDKITDFPGKLFTKMKSKTTGLDARLINQTEKYFDRLARKEAKLRKRLNKMDSTKTRGFFADDPQQQYTAAIRRLQTDTGGSVTSTGSEYLPYADSLQTTLAFLNKDPGAINGSRYRAADIQGAYKEMRLLQSRLQDADLLKQFVQQRKEQIRQCLLQYQHLPPGITGLCSDYNKQLYYYQAQVRQYREMLNDPDKVLTTALSLLNKLPAFNSFMKSNSMLAGLFTVPAGYNTDNALDGLQSRDQVLAMIQSQVGSGGPNATAAIQGSLQTAQQDINNMHDKLNKLGGGSGDMDIPNFKPNAQRTRTFLQRLEFGTNLQTQHAAYYFPTTTDLGLSIGYKLNGKNTVGVGASYKVGWGNSFSNIHISSQGIGLRSFIDIQAKKSFYLSGGFEYNYQPVQGTQQLYVNSWQRSGMVGISKIVSMKTKVFRKAKIQFLWDFLSYGQLPKTQPIKFRVGYNF